MCSLVRSWTTRGHASTPHVQTRWEVGWKGNSSWSIQGSWPIVIRMPCFWKFYYTYDHVPILLRYSQGLLQEELWKQSLISFSSVQFSSVQSLSRIWLFATPWIAARQASLSITISRSSLKPMSIESVMPSNHVILCRPFSSCPQTLPASESFPMSQLFAWGG